MRAAHAGSLVVVALLAAGCGKDEKPKEAGKTATTPATVASKPPARTTPAKPKPKSGAKPGKRRPESPKYRPGQYHKHRAPGVIYYNEGISEDVLSAPYDRIIELFGPPASRRGKCIRYRIVGGGPPNQNWEFCFKGQTMTAASVEPDQR